MHFSYLKVKFIFFECIISKRYILKARFGNIILSILSNVVYIVKESSRKVTLVAFSREYGREEENRERVEK